MARQKNQVETTRVTFSPSAEIVAYLDDLVTLGIHGKGRAEVVNNMVIREIERLIRDGFLKLRLDTLDRRQGD
jgi:hypothetical protein